jgi:hypothetical protein
VAWVNGGPGSHIPASTKRTVNARQADMCATIDRTICWGTIDEYDHIINVKSVRGDRSQLNNPDLIQGLCKPCHRLKTQLEARTARNQWKRKPERHPGLR